MPHDNEGHLLRTGDEAVLRCRIVSVFDTSDGFRDCNVNLQAIDPTGEGLYAPFMTCNARLVSVELARQLRRTEKLIAENDAVWEAIAHLETLLTAEQVHAELERNGVDLTKARERVRAALSKARVAS